MSKYEWVESNYSTRLKRARQIAELSQSELADRLGTRQPTISRIESGQEPRNDLAKRAISFVQEREQSSQMNLDDVAQIIGSSNELKRLIKRIAAEISA